MSHHTAIMPRALEAVSTETHSTADSLWDAASRKRALDIVWPLIYVTALLAVFLPWYLRLAEIDFTPIAWILFGATSAYVLLSWLLEILDSTRATTAGIVGAHVLGVVVLGAIWFKLGGLQVPGFLLFFALPVIAGGFVLARWGRPLTVGITLAVVVTAAALQSSSLRWYLRQVGAPLDWFEVPAAWLGRGTTEALSIAAPSVALITLLLSAAALLAVDACAGYLSARPRQIHARLRRMISASRQSEDLARELMRSSPLAEAVVFADNAQIMLVNDCFRETFGLSGTETDHGALFDVVRFRFPEPLEALVRGRDGSVECSYAAADGHVHSAIAHVRHAEHGGEQIARISLENRSREQCLAAALDALDDVVIVTDAADLIVHANPTARRIFPGAAPGTPAATALHRPDLPQAWWHTPPETIVPRQLNVAGEELRGSVAHRAADPHVGPTTVITLGRKDRS